MNIGKPSGHWDGCRVGITTEPQVRIAAWISEYLEISEIKWLFHTSNRIAAQQYEDDLAAQHGCEAHPGGAEPDRAHVTWHVYHFYFKRKKA